VHSKTAFIKKQTGVIFKYIAVIMFAVTALIPFLWVLISSLKENSEIYGSPFSLPHKLMLENYTTAWTTAKVGNYLLNSIVVSFSSVLAVVLIGSMAAYIISRVRPSFKLYTYFTLGIMIPVHTILIPTFIMIKNFGLKDTRPGLILIYIVGNLSLTIFILSGFFKTVPREIEEAAYIDGSSPARTFFSIIFPISKPGIATVCTLTFLNCWNEYLFSYIIISSADLKTITQGIFSLQGTYNTNYGPLCAGLIISIVPAVILYILFQEQVIKGMTAGAVKG